MDPIPFNKMSVVGREEEYILEALHSGKWCGRGPKTLALEKLVREKCQAQFVYFVTSCSSALEASCILSGIGPGDEVVLPSFGFVSAANAILRCGARPVFADVNPRTWNLSLASVEPCLSKRTKAILPVHYAGSSAGIDELRELCSTQNFFLIEDAAQSLGATRKGKPIGSTPWTTSFSLHETKNISCGEGGLIMTDNRNLAERIEILIEKGTNRQRFFRGQVDKYTWVDLGSSFVASDLLAAVALAQVEKLEAITVKRLKLWREMQSTLLEFEGKVSLQEIPAEIEVNGHVAAFLVDPLFRPRVLDGLRNCGVSAAFHYVPLHDAPFSREHGFAPEADLPHTRRVSDGLVRIPLYYSMGITELTRVTESLRQVLKSI